MKKLNDTQIDLFAMEDKVRELRAQAVSYGLRETRLWMAAKVSALFGRTGQTA